MGPPPGLGNFLEVARSAALGPGEFIEVAGILDERAQNERAQKEQGVGRAPPALMVGAHLPPGGLGLSRLRDTGRAAAAPRSKRALALGRRVTVALWVSRSLREIFKQCVRSQCDHVGPWGSPTRRRPKNALLSQVGSGCPKAPRQVAQGPKRNPTTLSGWCIRRSGRAFRSGSAANRRSTTAAPTPPLR